MPKAKDVLWFKQQFHSKIKMAILGTPFSLDMITAIACQETGEVWQVLRKRELGLEKILELCVGDTIDADGGRKVFPKTKAELIGQTKGQQMFKLAHEALVEMAQYIPSYKKVASRPNKFCHAFGIFQYDLQFFLKDPDYFLQKKYTSFDNCLAKCIGELHYALRHLKWQERNVLNDYEMAAVAIVYNSGGYNPSKGLKQGHSDGKRYYGETFFDYLRLSKNIIIEGANLLIVPVKEGNALLASPSAIKATGPFFEVDAYDGPLKLFKEPKGSKSGNTNIVASLPDGHRVQSVTDKKPGRFVEVETHLLGAHHRGFAQSRFLRPSATTEPIVLVEPAKEAPTSGIIAAYMPRKDASITKRTYYANAFSLNEPGQLGRSGTTPDELRQELAAIINWLAVDKKTNLRYQPRKISKNDTVTFCNVYAHDYCYLAGVYLPRVWWTPRAIEQLAKGEQIEPLIDKTIDEQRANDLFRWLRDFGLRFGWRQTGTLSKLQLEVNQGAVGLIVARRNEDGLPGDIVVVVPETNEQQAKRNRQGDVIAPVQSQAGAVNFRYGTGKINWWTESRFAEGAFWLHS